MRALALAAALLATGCVQKDPSASESEIAACSAPDDMPGRSCPYERIGPDCAALAVDPRQSGEAFEIVARLTNACDEPRWHQGLNVGEAEREGLASWILVNGTRYHFLAGAAWDVPTLAPAIPPGRLLDPLASVETTWPWNGSIARQEGDPCYCSVYERVPPGTYEVGAVVVRLPNVTATTMFSVG